MQRPDGLFANPEDGQQCIRQSIYTAIGLEGINKPAVERTYHSILNLLRANETLIDTAIQHRDPTVSRQNDVVGLLLFKIGELRQQGYQILRDGKDADILDKLVSYLKAIEYWKDKDNGRWNTTEEVHASSVGACVAGLSEIRSVIEVPKWLIMRGFNALNNLLPRESASRHVDLALLSLIYPFDIVYGDQREKILEAVEDYLLREKGVIRFLGDTAYRLKNTEAEFTFGLPWLAIASRKANKLHKFNYYRQKTAAVINEKGEFPEAFYGNTRLHNNNMPCGLTHALYAKMLSV